MNSRVVSTAAWPQAWGRGLPRWLAIAVIAMSVIVGSAFLFGIAGAAGVPMGLWFFALGAVGATLLPGQRPDRMSAGIRVTAFDPRTGRIDEPGGLPGVLVPEHPRMRVSFAAMTTLLILSGPAMWAAARSDLEFPPYLLVFGSAMAAFGVYLAVMFLIRKGPSRLVLTEHGFWINNSSSYRFVPWTEVRSVLPMRRGRNNFVVIQLTPTADPAVGKYFGFTHEPVVRKGVVSIGSQWFDLDAALLLYSLQFAADPSYRRKFATGEVIGEMAGTYPPTWTGPGIR